MLKFSMFKTAKPKQFEYKPRYYDPEKEAMEQKRKERGLSDKQTHSEQLRARMQYEWSRRKDRRRRQRNNTIKLFVFIALVVLILMWILK
jgi:ferric-dicitrate binding protein FerR (iron transport regulator)